MKLIEWFNGKKTIIGAILLFVAAFLTEVVIGFWGVTAAWIPPFVKTLTWLGMPLTGLGLGHKAHKAMNDNTP